MAHRSARLTSYGRLLLVQRVLEFGHAPAVVAEQLGVSRATVYKWLRRYRDAGEAGLVDRSSRPHRSPRALPDRQVQRVLRARVRDKTGPHQLGPKLGIARSTVYGVLRRHGMSRLHHTDRPTGVPIRYVKDNAGELMHVDVKKLGRVPAGGGWRKLGRQVGQANTRADRRRQTKEFIHSMVDDHSRVCYSEILDNELGRTCAEFLVRAGAWFAERGVRIQEVMTDEALNYTRSGDFKDALAVLGARHRTTGPYNPKLNGKVERFHLTLKWEWAYKRLYTSNAERRRAYTRWLRRYNHARPHTALGGLSPMTVLVNNVNGNDT